MWDFRIAEAIKLVVKTAPFIVLRLAVYFGITLSYLLATGTGAGIGYGLSFAADAPGTGALIGGAIGFFVITGVLYWVREYILYLVKAAHIAVLVEALEGRSLPAGKSQLMHGQEVVRSRFREASLLFGIDQLIKGVLRMINGTLRAVAFWLPVPGLSQIVGVFNAILNASLTYVDEIILAHNIRTNSSNPWHSSREALVLYAQNYRHMLKNAIFLLLFMYLFSVVIFLLILAPVGAVVSLFPGAVSAWSFITAILLAWSIKAALLEPLAVIAMTQVFFNVTDGQTPNPDWDQKLAEKSGKFRELMAKAKAFAPSTQQAPSTDSAQTEASAHSAQA